MKTEKEIQDRIGKLLDIRSQLVELGGKDGNLSITIGSIDSSIAQLRWVMGWEE